MAKGGSPSFAANEMPHPFAIPSEFVERTNRRQGRPHSTLTLATSSTALVVVDMQRYFIEEPFAGACPVAREIVPNVNRLAGAVRKAGGVVAWLQMEAGSLADSNWSALRERYNETSARGRWENLRPEAAGFELWPDLEIEPTDLLVVKNRYSAFIPGSSHLDEELRGLGVDTLLVGGVATNACCESTARDAMMLNYRVIMVSDACAAASDVEHASALNNFYLFFGDVQTTEEVLALLER